MGMGKRQTLVKVELPLAVPTILAGVRVATVSTVGLVTIGALVGYGGFGQLILSGFEQNFYHAQIATATICCVLLAVIFEFLLLGVQRGVAPWTGGEPGMNIFQWFTDPANWSGPDGIPVRTMQHIVISAGAMLIALVIAMPIGLILGHKGRAPSWRTTSAISAARYRCWGAHHLRLDHRHRSWVTWRPSWHWRCSRSPLLTNTITGISEVDPRCAMPRGDWG